MYNIYNFNKALDVTKLLADTPTLSFNPSSLETVPLDFLTKLEIICRESGQGNLPEAPLFSTHVSDASTYTNKEDLIEGLKLIYCYFTDKHASHKLSNDERNQFIDLLTQDIDQCTPGFHNRVISIVNQFTQPEDLTQLVYKVREKIVASVTEQLLKNNKIPLVNEIHLNNHVILTAHEFGLGIKPNLLSDPHIRLKNKNIIERELKNAFETHLTPYNLPFLLTEQIQALLYLLGYSGFKQDGYTMGEKADFMLTISKFISPLSENEIDNWQNYFLIYYDEDELPYIQDINWSVVRQALYRTLTTKHYIQEDLLRPCSLRDHIQECLLFDKDKEKNLKLIKRELLQHLKTNNKVFNAAVFIKSYHQYTPEERHVLFDLVGENWDLLIKNSMDFKLIFSQLTTGQRTVVFHAMEKQWSSLIKHTQDFQNIFSLLTSEQGSLLFDFVQKQGLSFIQSARDFMSTCLPLSSEQCSVLFDSMRKKLPLFINNSTHLSLILRYLSPSQSKVLLNDLSLEKKLDSILPTLGDIELLKSSLSTDQCKAIDSIIQNIARSSNSNSYFHNKTPDEAWRIKNEDIDNGVENVNNLRLIM